MAAYLLQTELAVRRAIKKQFQQTDPALGDTARITRCVWSDIHGRYYITVRLFGRSYHRNLTGIDPGECAAMVEGVLEAERARAPSLSREQ